MAVEAAGAVEGTLQLVHLHKGVALALVCAGVVDDFHALHIAETLEEVFQLALVGLVGEVTHVEAGVAGGRCGGSAAAALAGGGRVATVVVGLGHAHLLECCIAFFLLALVIGALIFLLLTETEEGEDALQERGFTCGHGLGARHALAAVAALVIVAAAAGTLALPALRVMFSHCFLYVKWRTAASPCLVSLRQGAAAAPLLYDVLRCAMRGWRRAAYVEREAAPVHHSVPLWYALLRRLQDRIMTYRKIIL